MFVADIAKRLRVSPQTVKRLLKQGKLQYTRVGQGGWRMVTEEEFKRYLNSLPTDHE